MTELWCDHSEYKKNEKGHFNTSSGVTNRGNINSLPGNFKDPVFSLERKIKRYTLTTKKM